MISNSPQLKLKNKRAFIQPKLTIGQPNDQYEQEADAVADQIMQMPHSPPSVQRKCEDCEEDHLQMKPIAQIITPILQKQSEEEEDLRLKRNESDMIQAKSGGASQDISSKLSQTNGSGSKMSARTNQFMNNAFGTDFSNVNIHTGSQAIQMSRSINARAFTNGNDIYFNKGEYNPQSIKGKHLLAHELTHVVQQKGADIIQRDPDWTEAELTAIQTQLRRLGLYPRSLTIDGIYGNGTRSGLVEAYGGDSWEGKTATNIISQLTAATPVAGTTGEHNLQYGEMFSDGILDFTLGIGFDETDAHLTQLLRL